MATGSGPGPVLLIYWEPAGTAGGGYDRGLLTTLRRADNESGRRSNARGQIGRRSAPSEQMRRSGSARRAVRAEQAARQRARGTLPHGG